MQAPGRMFLLVTGIIYIVSGSSDIIVGVFLEGLAQTISGLGNRFGVHGAGAEIGYLAFLTVILGAYHFVIGIMGISNRDNLEKGGTLMVLGTISLVVTLFLKVVMDAASMTLLLFFAAPICYIIGARKNKLTYESISSPEHAAYGQFEYGRTDSVPFGSPPPAWKEDSEAEVFPMTVLPEAPVILERQNIHEEDRVFKVQIGVFRKPANAFAYLTRLKSSGFNPALELFDSPRHGEVSRVFIPGVKASERLEFVQRLRNIGIEGTWIQEE